MRRSGSFSRSGRTRGLSRNEWRYEFDGRVSQDIGDNGDLILDPNGGARSLSDLLDPSNLGNCRNGIRSNGEVRKNSLQFLRSAIALRQIV